MTRGSVSFYRDGDAGMKSSLRVDIGSSARSLLSLFTIGFSLFILMESAHASDVPKWIRMSSAHFTMLTDVSSPRGEQAVLRLEQMRSVIGHQLMKTKMHLSLPLDIIGVKSDEEYIQIAPVQDGTSHFIHGIFSSRRRPKLHCSRIGGRQKLANVTAIFFVFTSNTTIRRRPAGLMKGLIEYLSSLQLSDEEGEMGSDPGSYLTTLNSQPWIPLSELFAMRLESESTQAHLSC